MSVRIRCPACTGACHVPEYKAGLEVTCGKCGQAFTLRQPPLATPVRPPGRDAPRLDIGSATSCGLLRVRNEDSYFVQHLSWSNKEERHEVALVAVADGLGGHEAGDLASGIGIRSINTALAPLLNGIPTGHFQGATPEVLLETVDFAIQEANRTIYRKAEGEPACKGMGATAAVGLLWDGEALLGHVGDCRVYHYHGGKLAQVTRDQTFVAEMMERGRLSSEEAKHHRLRNAVTEALGQGPDVRPVLGQLTLSRGDWLLVASDGLGVKQDNRALQDAVVKAPASAAALAEQLVEAADQRGGSDNSTVVAVRCY